MITREYLETRIQELTVVRDKLQADVFANNGAIQAYKHLQAILTKEEIDAAAAEIAKGEETEQPNGETGSMTDDEAEAVEETARRVPRRQMQTVVDP